MNKLVVGLAALSLTASLAFLGCGAESGELDATAGAPPGGSTGAGAATGSGATIGAGATGGSISSGASAGLPSAGSPAAGGTTSSNNTGAGAPGAPPSDSSGGCSVGHGASPEFGAAALALALIFATRRRKSSPS